MSPLDFSRIFFGDEPLLFLAEIALRSIFMYAYALILVRFMGKRGNAELSPIEFIVIIALGSAAGDPMLYPEVPILYGMVVITVVVGLHELTAWVTVKSKKINQVLDGTVACLIKEGKVQVEVLEKENIPLPELESKLRENGVEHTGQVRRAYLELSGEVSVFKYDPRDEKSGKNLLTP